jgi:hypothetical protein
MGNDAGGATGTALRNSLWNLLFRVISSTDFSRSVWAAVLRGACLGFFREPIDELPSENDASRLALKDRFFAMGDDQVYDFFEFILGDDRAAVKEMDRKLIRRGMNDLLQREGAGVRLYRDRFRPYADDLGFEEMAEAEGLVRLFDMEAARRHLDAAHAYLMRRPSPDSRSALREAVLAVAAVALEVARRAAEEGEATPLLVVGSVAYAAKAAGIPPALLPGIEALLHRAHALSGLPIGEETRPPPDAVDDREARLLVVFASSLIVFLLGKREEGGTVFA